MRSGTLDTIVSSSTQNHALAVQKQRKRLLFVDVLNIVSSFAVVLLHTSIGAFSPERSPLWLSSLLSQSLAIFAVPIFFMVSGMNLIGYRSRYSTRVFLKRRLLRVGVSLFLASLFAYLLLCAFPHSFFGAESFEGVASAGDFLTRFLSNGILDIYWFLYAIIYLYLLTPLLSLMTGRRRVQEYVLTLCLIVSVIIPFMTHLGVDYTYFQTLFGWPLFSNVNLFYFLLGFYISAHVRPPRRIWPLVGTYLLSAGLMFVGGLLECGYFGSSEMSPYNNYLIGITSPFCVLMSVSLFQLARSLEGRLQGLSDRVRQAISRISGCAFGVYLFHILLVNLTGGGLLGKLLNHFSNPFVRAILIYAATLCLVALAKNALHAFKRLTRE